MRLALNSGFLVGMVLSFFLISINHEVIKPLTFVMDGIIMVILNVFISWIEKRKRKER